MENKHFEMTCSTLSHQNIKHELSWWEIQTSKPANCPYNLPLLLLICLNKNVLSQFVFLGVAHIYSKGWIISKLNSSKQISQNWFPKLNILIGQWPIAKLVLILLANFNEINLVMIIDSALYMSLRVLLCKCN